MEYRGGATKLRKSDFYSLQMYFFHVKCGPESFNDYLWALSAMQIAIWGNLLSDWAD